MTENLYYIVIIATFVFFLLTFFIIYVGVFQNRRKSFFKQEIMKAQMEIKEQTLQHISYELHDNLGQVASLIKINLNTLNIEDKCKALEKIEDTKDLIRQLIGDLKSLSISLNSDRIAQTGLVKALETEVERLNKTGQFSASLLQESSMPVIDKDKAVILYRMAQEVLNNSVKHSGAKQIKVSLTSTGNLFTLAFSDDGVGFNAEEKMNSGGAGLINLQNRARLINAQLTMNSTPGNGSTVTIQLPL